MQQFTQFLLTLFDQYELPILFLLLFIEADGLFLPIPGDIFLLLANTRHEPSIITTGAIVLVALIATNLGAYILYTIVRRIGHDFVEKYGKYILLSPPRLHKLENFYQKHGQLAITSGWLLPGLRVPTAIMAGVADIPANQYIPSALLGSMLWTIIYSTIGIVIYSQGSTVDAFTQKISQSISPNLVAGIVLAIILAYIAFRIARRIWERRRYYLHQLANTVEEIAEHVEEFVEDLGDIGAQH
jgi:membrane protein DedA with SNARE-associated domain